MKKLIAKVGENCTPYEIKTKVQFDFLKHSVELMANKGFFEPTDVDNGEWESYCATLGINPASTDRIYYACGSRAYSWAYVDDTNQSKITHD